MPVITGLWPGLTCSIILQIMMIQWLTMAVELIGLGNSCNNVDMFDMFWYGFGLPEKNAEKDNGMIVSSANIQSASNHALA